MNTNRITLLLAAALVSLPGLVTAGPGLFQWTGLVEYDNGTEQQVSAYSAGDCQAMLQNAADHPPPGADVAAVHECRRNALPGLGLWQKVDPLDIGCVVCGLLTKDNIVVAYPDYAEYVLDLTRQYGIDSYREEFRALNSQYNLKGFQQKMGQLERYLDGKNQ